MSTNAKNPTYNPKYNSFNNEFLSFIFKEDAKESIYKNKPHFYGLIEYTKHNVLVLGYTELMTWVATALARNNAVTYITYEKELYEKFIKTVNDFNFGGDDVGILCKDEKDYINNLQDLKDMKFDKVIMNPPYGTLANKIITKAFDLGNEVVSLNPTTTIDACRKYKQKRKESTNIYNFVKDYKITEIVFDGMGLQSELAMFKFTHEGLHIPFEDLVFRNLSDYDKQLFNKICKYECVISNYIKHYSTVPTDGMYFRLKRLGHHGVNNWDFTVLYSNQNYKAENTIKGGYTNKIKEGGSLIKCKDNDERERLKQFLDSDILMYAIKQVRFNTHLDNHEWDYIPFDESLDESVLIKKLGLTEDDVAYIKDKMKKFGHKAKRR